jgi:putative membrane protein
MMTGWSMGIGGLGFVLMAVFWVAIIAAAIWLLGNIFPRNNVPRVANDTAHVAVDILKQRYARGELSKEEFEALRQDIES